MGSAAVISSSDVQQVADAQPMRALENANRIRVARARIKRDIAAGHTTVADAIRDPEPAVIGMRIFELLTSQKRWGDKRCRKFLQSVSLPEDKTVGSLTERQRIALATVLEAKQPRARLSSAAEVTFRAR